MSGAVRTVASVSACVALLLAGCLAGSATDPGAGPEASGAETSASAGSGTGSWEPDDAWMRDFSVADLTQPWVQPGAFDEAAAGDEGCGFEAEAWTDHHGFRIPSDPYRERRSLERVTFDDGSPGTPFSLTRGGMGVFVFANGYTPGQYGPRDPGTEARANLERFLGEVTTASGATIEEWAGAVAMNGHVQVWMDPAWPGWSEYDSTDYPKPSGEPPAEPPPELFRVRELYVEVTGGPRPVDPAVDPDREEHGPWTFGFSVDHVEAVRHGASSGEVVLVDGLDTVRYMRLGKANVDDATMREAIRNAWDCVGLSEPDLEGVQLAHMPWPPRDGDDEDGVDLPQLTLTKDTGAGTLTVLDVDREVAWDRFTVAGCGTLPAPADLVTKGDVLSECAGTVRISYKETGHLLYEATFA